MPCSAADASQVQHGWKVIGEVAAGRPVSSTRSVPGESGGGFVPGRRHPRRRRRHVVIQGRHARRTASNHHRHRACGQRPGNIRPAGTSTFNTRATFLLARGEGRLGRPRPFASARRHEPSGKLPVHRKPKVAILATGDGNWWMPGEPLGPGQIVYSNGYAFACPGAGRRRLEGPVDLGHRPPTVWMPPRTASAERPRGWRRYILYPRQAARRSADMTSSSGR